MKPGLYSLITIIVALVAYVYISYYIRVHPSMSLLQSTVDKVDFDMLNSKLPIVITDRIVNLHDILVNLFRYQYTFIETPTDTSTWLRNSHKFAVLKSNSNDKVQVAHPGSKMESGVYGYLDLVLRKDQVVILPYGWWLLAHNADVYMLDDMVSKLISYVA